MCGKSKPDLSLAQNKCSLIHVETQLAKRHSRFLVLETKQGRGESNLKCRVLPVKGMTPTVMNDC